MTIDSASRTVPAGGSASAGRRLALGAVAGPVLFTAGWLVLGFTSTGYTLFDHTFTDYSPVSQPISGLGMGATAGYMNTAFVATGLLLIAGVVGVFRATGDREPSALRRTALVLLAATGAGQIVCGVFDLEAVMPHMLGFLLALGTPVVGFPVAGRYFRTVPGWRRFGTWLMLGGPLTLALLIAFFATFQPTADGAEHGVAGLVQRLGVLEVHAWYVAMGVLALRRHRSRPR
ncbi:hypothetical protein DPM19_29980 [Actinomadura craniellae]|uniref:DUF998 domain-containing protein n=1 Tax=Actinomadura craniellae TaxID=2231787 RepID=A0A365GXG7_9ACTN|nr:DUF998 domain-containing protein [Actinomadura craniellae]RAY11534.1 hypothetical protein DPM19_29980 [Actinomadura craniellae]